MLKKLHSNDIDPQIERTVMFFVLYKDEDGEKGFVNSLNKDQFDCVEVEYLQLFIYVTSKTDETTIANLSSLIFTSANKYNGIYYGWDTDIQK